MRSRRLAADGYDVHAISRSAADSEAATAAGVPATVCDVTREDAVEQLIGRLGPLRVIVDAHGVYEHSLPATDTDSDAFRRVLDINVTGAFIAARAAARTMQPGGVIGSVNGLAGEPGAAAYNASKAAVHSLTQTLAVELADRGIRVVCVAPGWVRTAMTEFAIDDDVRSGRRRFNPQGRVAEPDEIAALVAWLCTSDAGFITGSVITIDGGQMALLPPAWVVD